mmetsp:Transcript_185/g.420  ORF Transcript_185/g.420 Transcript_185/m.420 type:complete len:204 (-) Transcript_185:109-720(-)|eukprot:CAMPEP_0206461470 /NCGR_PEP_ID=MMETSP0324_2-20121206/25386_1 /ASSEMBLY_ACC=CAM_ASM_000836 /TAXON_ID=2866 /ORGANISM="Crypthecodinium cohnii, Strain Seligo" /LENGTH=203 /DNA_ID=CAMNT_0053933409 /DNA_START=46 /DNA_END=657 /DNA_ORIENTATION=+
MALNSDPDANCSRVGTVTYRQLDDFKPEQYGKIVHLKGFARLIDFGDEKIMSLSNLAVDFLVSRQPDTIVWDGDSYALDSFTRLLPRLAEKTKAELVMFLRDRPADRARTDASWPRLGLNITCYLTKPEIEFEELGEIALRSTASAEIVSFGGGVVVANEFKVLPERIRLYLVPAYRTSDAGVVEHCALETLQAPNLEHVLPS